MNYACLFLWFLLMLLVIGCEPETETETKQEITYVFPQQPTSGPVNGNDVIEDPEDEDERINEPPPRDEDERIDEPPPDEDPGFGGDEFTVNERFAMLVLGPNSRIFVQNTIREHGLHIRNSAGIPAEVAHENGDANIIGHVKNRATGTIISEHKIVDGHIWFKIKWDKDAEGRCILNKEGLCIGWSAAVSAKDNLLINEIGN